MALFLVKVKKQLKLGASGKIRVMLAVLFATLLFTAIIIQKTNSPVNNLAQSAETLEHNLQKKEIYVNGLINNKTSFNQLKELSHNPDLALGYIQRFTSDRSIWFITFYNNNVSFWSGVKVLPDNPAVIKEGYSFRLEANAYFEEIKKTQGNFSVIFFIPVKGNYSFQNQYLKNVFSPDLVKSQNIEIAGLGDKNAADIKTSDQTHLFSVKLKSGEIDPGFFYYEITIWLLALIVLCILIQDIHSYIAKKGYLLLSFIFLALFIIVIRFVNLHLGWPDLSYKLSLFDHDVFTLNSVFPSLGDLCINILFITWFVGCLYTQRKKFFKNPVGKISGYVLFITGIIILIAVSTALVDLFYSLVVRSKINFDISNVLNLSYLSVLGILMLCFSFLIFFLLAEVFLTVSFKLSIPNLTKASLLLLFIVLATLFSAYYQAFSLFYILWGTLVIFRGSAYYSRGGLLTSGSVAVTIFIFAVIASLKLNYFNAIKENKNRITFIKKLEAPDDSTADRLFKIIEKKIPQDPAIIQYFQDTIHGNNNIKTRLQKLYFNGYLSRYDLKVSEFGKDDQSIGEDKNFKLRTYADLVLYTAHKFSLYFYRENGSFGFIKYFAIIPLMQNGEKSGNIVIELKSKPFQPAASFPGLLVEGGTDSSIGQDGYSYAFYEDGKLLNQSGNFVYNLVNSDLTGQLHKYIIKTTSYDGDVWFKDLTSFTHLIYKQSNRYLIVVSRENKPLYFAVTSITFFFVLLLLFSILVILVRWLWLRVRILSIKDDRIKWNFKLNFDLILYKTRIQFSMVFAVVATLLLAGIVTFISISNEYQAQLDKSNRDKIHQIATAFENGQYAKYINNKTEATQVNFDDFANDFSTDLTLFDSDGRELITTEPKIYDLGLQAGRMNARAFVNLHDLQKSEFANNEKIGLFNYRAFFIPIRNSYKTIAYLELPYFSNEADYREHIGALLNMMINVYAIVFMAIGLFAVFIARQITSPLNFIQYSLSKTIYGQKNEPIRWDRNDEIGALVKEYNKMIAALEHSAQKLAQSERESAWREMAKQVAHEIKNPLTPLKLGLQLLDKSWRDKDPKFDQKFERFSKSFVEQIESLSSIASEFSAFAKMPETKLEQLNVFDMLGQAVTIFKEMDNIKIIYSTPENRFLINADRDQLLRCFNNLLKNAIEATPPDRQGIIEINYLITSKNIMLTIKDNGQGIPEVMREKIFEPNFTTKSSGTGLGLAFVKNSIENAGGKIWFETITGEGTTFYLSLPASV